MSFKDLKNLVPGGEIPGFAILRMVNVSTLSLRHRRGNHSVANDGGENKAHRAKKRR